MALSDNKRSCGLPVRATIRSKAKTNHGDPRRLCKDICGT
jgi:hypothetical protein